MKAILMSIRPLHVMNILNKFKTLEIRKRFPSDYVGWVYIYCTHGRHLLDLRKEDTKDNYRLTNQSKSNNVRWSYPPLLNGKVVARFWCDKVEEINKITMYCRPYNLFETETLQPSKLLKQSCLTAEEMTEYFRFYNLPKESAAIHITKLEIFNKPKEISEFHWYRKQWVDCGMDCPPYVVEVKHTLTRAPQSYCFIEVDL